MVEVRVGYTPVVALDSKVHILTAEEHLKQKFPDLSCTVVTDPKKIEEVMGKTPSADQALVEVIIPDGKAPEIFKTWVESLSES